MDIKDIYSHNYSENVSTYSNGEVQDLIKAMSAGNQTGRDLDGQITSGSALKTESLDPALKVLTNKDQHIVFWKTIPKQKAYNTVEEYNQLVDYGGSVGIFNTEGETPQFTDSQYRRESVLVKYMGVSGEVTHPFQLVNLGSGVGNALSAEVYNKMQYLVRAINKSLPTSNSSLVSNEFDGFFKQHYDGIIGSSGTLDTYTNSSSVIDARGKALTQANVEDASQAVVNDGFGMVSTIMGSPVVFSDFAKRFHSNQRTNIGQPGAVVGATVGQSISTVETQFGNIGVSNDIFFDRDRITARAYNQAATSTKAPAAPVTSAVAAVTDTSTKFADGAGDYFYAVSAKNRYGESQVVILNTSAVTVATTEAVNLTWTHTDGNYAVESFVVYRTEVDASPYTTAKFYPIFEVSAAEWTAGYDGGAAGIVRDRNRSIANTTSAMVTDMSIDVLAYKQLAPMMRMDLARTSPSQRFMVLNYGTPVLFAPKKMARIINIGRDLT